MVRRAWASGLKHRRSQRQSGFTYLFVLIAVALLGVGLAAESEVWTIRAQRQKLVELDWMGNQFVQAIGSYYQNSPGVAKSYPGSLQDLLDDQRLGITRRYLRVIYRNPFSGVADWEPVVGSDQKIRGVRARYRFGQEDQMREFIYLPPVNE